MKVLLVINVEAHAVGTLARLFALHAPVGWKVRIVSCYHMDHNPTWFRRWVDWADVVHWTNHKVFSSSGHFRKNGRHIVSVHHFEGDEGDAGYLKEAECVVVHAVSVEKQVRERVGADKPVFRVAYPVADVFFDIGRKKIQQSVTRNKQPVIGFFSSARYETPRKGIDLLPAVLERLNQFGIKPILHVTGDGWQEVLRQRQFSNYDIRHIAVPSYFDMPAQYESLDVYLCLSRLEGGPMTVFEAIACGVPVVSTPVGRIPDSLTSADYRAIPIDDAKAAADAIADVLKDVNATKVMLESAIKRIHPVVDVSGYVQGLSNLYGATGDSCRFRLRLPSSSQIRGYRSSDRLFLGAELRKIGDNRSASRHMLYAFCIAPFCLQVWRFVFRGLGVVRDEVR